MKYAIVGDGLVASVFKGLPEFEVVHRDEWFPIRWDGIVNCAGLSSRTMCDEAPFHDVLEANVWLPMRMRKAIDGMQKPVQFIQMSSCAVYKHPASPDTPLKEADPTFPLHTYNASKILMEHVLDDTGSYIFRIPRVITDNGHPGDFKNHVVKWMYIEDRPISIVRGEALLKAVRVIMQGSSPMSDSFYNKVPPDTYNISTEVVELTEIVASYGIHPEIVPADSMEGIGPWPVLNTEKAKRYGLI